MVRRLRKLLVSARWGSNGQFRPFNESVTKSQSPNAPAATPLFWLTLLSACALGEAAGDLLSHGLKLGYAVSSLGLGVAFLAVMAWELTSKGFYGPRYWLAIGVTATVGTTLADLMTRTLKLGYAAGTALLAAILAAILLPGGRKGVGEVRYWAAILTISTLGTSLGDFISNDSGLGFGGTALLIAALLAVVFMLDRAKKLPSKAAYWTAVLLTSTFGAAAGDFLTKEEGLNLGTFKGTALLAVVVAAIALAPRRRVVGQG